MAHIYVKLISKGYKVVGTYRRASTLEFWRWYHLGIYDHQALELVAYDLTDLGSAIELLNRFNPDEVYNQLLKALLELVFSSPQPPLTTGLGPLNLLKRFD